MPEVVGRLRTPRLAAAPASPAQGELYFDTATSKLYWWSGSAWVDATGGGGGGALSYLEADLGSNVTMTNSGTVYDGPSVSLTAGTWLIVGLITVRGAQTTIVNAQLWDGTTIEAISEQQIQANNECLSFSLCGIVVVASTATYRLAARANATGATIRASTPTGGASATASIIRAVKIA